MDTTATQNLRVIARRLNTTIDERYINVIKNRVKMDDSFWASRSGSMLLVSATIFFYQGIRGSRAFMLGKLTSCAFYAINHAEGETPNIRVAVAKAVHENRDTIAVTADEIISIVELLVEYYNARSKEKDTPSVGNIIAHRIVHG